MVTQHKKIDYLEALRFTLAFLTMTWHYYYFGPRIAEVNAVASNEFPLRYFSFSVEVFFAISGFIIVASAINRRPIDFLIGRLVRLGPCLLVCATISMAAGLIFGHHPSLRSYFASILVLPLAVTNGADWSYWSLRLEIVFYAVIFLAACFVSIEKNILRIAWLLLAYDTIGILCSQVFGVDVYGSAGAQYPVDHYVSFFAIGMLLYLMLGRKTLSWGIALACVVAICNGSFRCYEEANRVAKLVHDAPVGWMAGAAILLVGMGAFALCVRSTANTRVAAIFSVLGKISYPLYLLHQNMGYLLIRFGDKHLGGHADARPLVMAVMVLLSGVIALYAEPVLARFYRRNLSRLAGVGGTLISRLAGAKRSYGDVE